MCEDAERGPRFNIGVMSVKERHIRYIVQIAFFMWTSNNVGVSLQHLGKCRPLMKDG